MNSFTLFILPPLKMMNIEWLRQQTFRIWNVLLLRICIFSNILKFIRSLLWAVISFHFLFSSLHRFKQQQKRYLKQFFDVKVHSLKFVFVDDFSFANFNWSILKLIWILIQWWMFISRFIFIFFLLTWLENLDAV